MNAFVSSVAPSALRANTFIPSSCNVSTRFSRFSVSRRSISASPVHVTTPPSMTLPDVSTLSSTFSTLSENPGWLTALANAFATLKVPDAVVTYGHPALMGFMILGMGLPGAVFGWQGRLNDDKKKGLQQKQLHENIMVAFFLLAAFGGFGGTLSTAMQGYDVWQSPHAISAGVVLGLLGANSVVAYSGFTIGNDGTPKGRLEGRKLHAYFGIAVMTAFALHIFFGVQILLG